MVNDGTALDGGLAANHRCLTEGWHTLGACCAEDGDQRCRGVL